MTAIDEQYLKLIESSRVSPQTQAVLMARLVPSGSHFEPLALTSDELFTLRSVLDRVIPQKHAEIDVAAQFDKQLAEARGDGWRYATLPNDLEANRIALALLDEFAAKLSAVPFGRLSTAAQDSLLEAIASGRLRSPKLDLKRWFEDLRAVAVQLYVSDPRTLARMGYSGIADDPNGFIQIGIGQREDWEPESR